MKSIVRKAIIPVAGFGTRFLPATKAQPKEMLPLVDKPIIQYIVEEAVAAGIEEIIFITSQTKRAIEDHFDRNFELEYRLKEQGKTDLLKQIESMFKLAQFVYLRQPSPRSWGDAALQAEHLIGDDPFAVFFGDDIIDSKVPAIRQMIKVYQQHHSIVLGVTPVKKSVIHNFGIIKGQKINARTYKVERVLEKPTLKQAPSNLAVTTPFILTPNIFPELRKLRAAPGKEINFYDALKPMLKAGRVYAYAYDGQYFDCGSKLGYLQATVHYGLKHRELRQPFKKFLAQTIKSHVQK